MNAPQLTDADVAAAVEVLSSGILAGPDHPAVQRFETSLAGQSRVPHAVAVNSGTAALHCILRALRIGPGDEVIVPAHTFIATATPVLMVGATPVVVDIDASTYCIDPAAVDTARSTRTKAVVAVHINGHPAPVDQLPADLPIISDACQAHGATLFATPVGALGRAAAFSFWQDKLITAAGEGGAVLTADEEIARHVRLLRSHAQEQIDGGPDAHHVALGYNYRLTGVQAAVGRSQLARLPSLVRRRRAIAERLTRGLADTAGLAAPAVRSGAEHAFWKYVVSISPGQIGGGRGELRRLLGAAGVATAPRYPIPLTRQPVLSGSARIMPCPVAESLADRLLTLPIPATEQQADRLCEAVRGAVQAARR
ncbi:DegT/DnrJ/EryC1/StrS family aminotransferase [Dactylosporangium sp. CA-139066]|uniref:DegT/DnrJ/EryC1/StrS family aminotransferase n=1 Tax=Dactylosporangium sp. CA-139066 TaxID=3239930 RepID=UPI003D8F3C61